MSTSPGENRQSGGGNAESKGERREWLRRRLARVPWRSPSLGRSPFLAWDVLKPIEETKSLSGGRVP